MWLLFVIVVNAVPIDFSIISTVSDTTTVSRFSSHDLSRYPGRVLSITGRPVECAHLNADTYLISNVDPPRINIIYSIAPDGSVKWNKTYETIRSPVIDRGGNAYAIINNKVMMIQPRDSVKYAADRKDRLDTVAYDDKSDKYYLGISTIVGNHFRIIVMKNWGVIRKYFLPDIYRVWDIVPHNGTIYIIATNTAMNYVQMLKIDESSIGLTTIATYNNTVSHLTRIDFVTTSTVYRNNIYSIMNNVVSQKSYLVMTNLTSHHRTIREIPFNDVITCIYPISPY
jgi:hypothetical protein